MRARRSHVDRARHGLLSIIGTRLGRGAASVLCSFVDILEACSGDCASLLRYLLAGTRLCQVKARWIHLPHRAVREVGGGRVEDALEMGKQHLDALSVATGLFEGICAGERAGNIAGMFINAAGDLAGSLGQHSVLYRHTSQSGLLALYSIWSLFTILPVVVKILNAGQM